MGTAVVAQRKRWVQVPVSARSSEMIGFVWSVREVRLCQGRRSEPTCRAARGVAHFEIWGRSIALLRRKNRNKSSMCEQGTFRDAADDQIRMEVCQINLIRFLSLPSRRADHHASPRNSPTALLPENLVSTVFACPLCLYQKRRG